MGFVVTRSFLCRLALLLFRDPPTAPHALHVFTRSSDILMWGCVFLELKNGCRFKATEMARKAAVEQNRAVLIEVGGRVRISTGRTFELSACSACYSALV
jgi:hypothetical protein